MAETPAGYFPDLNVQFNIRNLADHLTEVNRARNGREQRRGLFPTSGLRRFTASGDALTQSDRRAVYDFLQTQRGRLGAFYFWNPPPRILTDVSVGSVTAQTRLIIPYRITNPSGNTSGSITDVRVAGITQTGYTLTSLVPRPTTFAALRFTGAGDYVTCGTSSNLRPTGDFTCAAWVFPTSTPASCTIMGNFTNAASGFIFFITSTGKLEIITASAGGNTAAISTRTLPLNTWSHVAAVRSGSNVTFYINGVAEAAIGGVTNLAAATAAFTISDPTLTFFGMINDARFYNTTGLAGSEITNIYNNAATATPNLRGWWKLTEGTGTTAADSSGYVNTGTLTASPPWVAGEVEILFSGAQTGAVTVTGTMRDRLVARFDTDNVSQGFMQDASDVRAIFDLAIQELI